MADRRRRKCLLNENSDCESEGSGEEQPINNSSNQGSEVGNSEYESVDEEELADADADADKTLEEGHVPLVPGDGEDLKSLDHDEDRKNPQYIPKKGTFYEHDDRTMGEGEETVADNVSEKSVPQEKEAKKKVWKEDGKWQHDRFSIYDQSPKSREELVATYGYDIRNEEGPPRARRRRRYGRGPNKYTRNWEDMDAYSKPTRGRGEIRGGPKGRGGRNKLPSSSLSGEEYPSLPSKHTNEEKEEIVVETQNPASAPAPAPTTASTQVESPKVISTSNTKSEPYENISSSSKNTSFGDQGNRMYVEDQKRDIRGIGRGSRPSRKMRPGSRGPQRNYGYSEEVQPSNRNRVEAGRGEGIMKTSRGRYIQAQGAYVQQNYQSKDVHDLTEELKTVTITPSMQKEELHYKKNKIIDNRRATIPPRLQETMRVSKPVTHGGGIDPNSVSKPKRYSSQRQKPLQDQIGQYHHPQGYYDQTSAEPDYNKIYEQVTSSPGAAAPQLALPTHAAPPSAFVAPFTTTSTNTFPPNTRLFPSGTPQPHLIGPPVAGPPIGPPPVAGPGVSGPPVPGTVGGAPVTGPPFLPPENMINFATPPPALVTAPHPPQFPAFQAFTPVSQQQPQEIYSNGVTYYNTQSQQHLPRINPVFQKRPKAAIPIVPPPDKQRYTKEETGNDYRNRSVESPKEDIVDNGNKESTTSLNEEYSISQMDEEHSISQMDACVTECPTSEETSEDPNGDDTDSIQQLERSFIQMVPNLADDSEYIENVTDEPLSAVTEKCEKSELESSLAHEPNCEVESSVAHEPNCEVDSSLAHEPNCEVESSLAHETNIKVNGDENNITLDVQSIDIQVPAQSEEIKSLSNCDKISTESKQNKEDEVTDMPLDTT